MSNQNIKAERGSVISTILEVLKSGDKYGYEIIKEVELKTGVILKQPSLYSCLTRLENQGVITSYWTDSDIGGRRHYYKYVNLPEDNATVEVAPNEKTIIKSDNEELLTITYPINYVTFRNNDILNKSTENSEQISNEILEAPIKSEQHDINSSITLHQIFDKQVNTNLKLMSFLKNNIKAHQEQERLKNEEIQNVEINCDSEKITINNEGFKQTSNYRNILGDMLYETVKYKDKNSNFAQQAFDFEHDEIKVENDKKYLNNVLFKSATKSKKQSNLKTSERKKITSFTSFSDLKTALSYDNVKVKEYSFINYKINNNQRYIKSNTLFLFNLLQLIIYSLLTVFSYKLLLLPTLSSYFLSMTVILLIFSLISYISCLLEKNKYLKFKIIIHTIIILLQVTVSFLIAFRHNYNIFSSFNFIYPIILLPFLFIIISFVFTKKAEKF